MDRCYRLAWSILANDADAADATQDAFVAAWRELPSLRDTAAFDGWLNRSDALVERDAMGRALDRLSPADRTILALHHLDERPVVEIARTLRVPLGTAKWRLYTARKALVRAMEAEW